MKTLFKQRGSRIFLYSTMLLSLVMTACKDPVGTIGLAQITSDPIYVDDAFSIGVNITATHGGDTADVGGDTAQLWGRGVDVPSDPTCRGQTRSFDEANQIAHTCEFSSSTAGQKTITFTYSQAHEGTTYSATQAITVTILNRPVCGNDILEQGETCEADSDCASSEVCSDSCDCVAAAVCGDGTVEQNEACEVNNNCATGEFCNVSCGCETITAVCGDGILDSRQGEVCEANSDCGSGEFCNVSCGCETSIASVMNITMNENPGPSITIFPFESVKFGTTVSAVSGDIEGTVELFVDNELKCEFTLVNGSLGCAIGGFDSPGTYDVTATFTSTNGQHQSSSQSAVVIVVEPPEQQEQPPPDEPAPPPDEEPCVDQIDQPPCP